MAVSTDSVSISGRFSVPSSTATWLTVVAVVIGHVSLLLAFLEGIDLITLTALEVGLLVVAAGAELLFGSHDRGVLGTLVFAGVLLVGGTVMTTFVWDLWVASPLSFMPWRSSHTHFNGWNSP